MWLCELDSPGSRQREVADSCKCSNESRDFIECGEFLNKPKELLLCKELSSTVIYNMCNEEGQPSGG
jgi:hypothetical protein